jgi:hypothetical protein
MKEIDVSTLVDRRLLDDINSRLGNVDPRDRRIAELEAALEVAAQRFEWLATHNDEMVNGVRPSVGAAEARQVVKG